MESKTTLPSAENNGHPESEDPTEIKAGLDDDVTVKMMDQDAEARTDNNKSRKNCCKHGLNTPEVLSKWLPPQGFPGRAITRGLICVVAWASLWSIVGKDLLPGGNLFSLFILIVFASLAGFFVRIVPKFTLPPLLGMLIVGFLLRNVPGINVAKNVDKQWSSGLRNTALVVILLRSGLGLDIAALRRLKCTVLRLAFTPCAAEAITVAVASHLLLKLPWLWAFQLG